MKLVKLSKYSDIYINMDYITEVSKSINEYYVDILYKHNYKIDEEAYNTILSYGKANV